MMVPVCQAQSFKADTQGDSHGDSHQDSLATLTVKVNSDTQDGATIVGDGVMVEIYRHNKRLQLLEGSVGADGQVVFDDVIAGGHVIAIARVKHQDMLFTSRTIELQHGAGEFTLNVAVYDVSMDASKLSIGTHHFMVKPVGNTLIITEYIQIINPTDKAIISSTKDSAGKNIVIDVKLPTGFKNFSSSRYFDQSALVITDEGFYDTMAVPPGKYEAVFSYALDAKSADMDIVKKITMPTQDFMFFSQLGVGKVKGLGDSFGQVNLADGTLAEYFPTKSYKPGDQLNIQIRGLASNTDEKDIWVIMIVAFALVVSLLAVRLLKKKK